MGLLATRRPVYDAALLSLFYLLACILLDRAMLPDGVGFALLLLYICAKLLGIAVHALSNRLPPLLGMLVAGLALRNIPGEPLRARHSLLHYDFEWWSRTLRSGALAIIMLRAGLGLDLDKLRKMGVVTARLSFLPCFSEALTIALLSVPLLDLPVVWGGVLGFVVAAVSPAVVVPGMLDLQERGFGTAKGIPTMVVAAASFDDVLAIAGFGVCLSLAAQSEEDEGGSGDGDGDPLAWLILKAPTELIAGIALGIGLGAAAAFPLAQPAIDGRRRSLAAVGGAMFAVFGGKEVSFSGGGALAAVVYGCTASRAWGEALRKPVQADVNLLWLHAQPALFGLLGAAVDVKAIEPSELGAGIGVLLCALLCRIVVTRAAVSGAGLTWREAGLVCVAWLPKATVQAAVGGAALDLVRERNLGREAEDHASLVLTLSVLVILLTAPAGAIGIALLGPAWLEQETAGAVVLQASSSAAAASSQENGDANRHGAPSAPPLQRANEDVPLVACEDGHVAGTAAFTEVAHGAKHASELPN